LANRWRIRTSRAGWNTALFSYRVWLSSQAMRPCHRLRKNSDHLPSPPRATGRVPSGVVGLLLPLLVLLVPVLPGEPSVETAAGTAQSPPGIMRLPRGETASPPGIQPVAQIGPLLGNRFRVIQWFGSLLGTPRPPPLVRRGSPPVRRPVSSPETTQRNSGSQPAYQVVSDPLASLRPTR
jgi:hypothetical protein